MNKRGENENSYGIFLLLIFSSNGDSNKRRCLFWQKKNVESDECKIMFKVTLLTKTISILIL